MFSRKQGIEMIQVRYPYGIFFFLFYGFSTTQKGAHEYAAASTISSQYTCQDLLETLQTCLSLNENAAIILGDTYIQNVAIRVLCTITALLHS